MEIKTLKETKNIIKDFYLLKKQGANPPVLAMFGDAGIGKTQIVEQAKEELEKDLNIKIPMTTLSLSATMDPETIAGFAVKGEGNTFLMQYRPSIYELTQETQGIFFIDEIGRESSEVRAILLKLMSDGILNELKINALIVMAGNPPDEKYTTKEVDAAMYSRFYPIEIKPVVSEVSAYFKEKIRKIELEKLTPGEKYKPDLNHPLRKVANYLIENPKHLLQNRDLIWLSPRTWEYAANILLLKYKDGKYSDDIDKLLFPILGDVAKEFKLWMHSEHYTFYSWLSGEVTMKELVELFPDSLMKILLSLEEIIISDYDNVIKFLLDKDLPLKKVVILVRTILANNFIMEKFPNLINDLNDLLVKIYPNLETVFK